MLTVNATDVRKEWGGFIDSIVRDKPKLIKRSRDHIVAISLDMLREILKFDQLHISLMHEDDGSVSGVIEELDLTGNAPDMERLLQDLAHEAIDYANEYYNDFSYWHSAPNRREHLAYVLAILACEPQNVAKELFVCQAGEN